MTRGLSARAGDDELMGAIKAEVAQHLTPIAAVEVDLDSDFSFDDVGVVEVRVITDGEPTQLPADDVDALRSDLFDILAHGGNDRIPLLRFISKADYFRRER